MYIYHTLNFIHNASKKNPKTTTTTTKKQKTKQIKNTRKRPHEKSILICLKYNMEQEGYTQRSFITVIWRRTTQEGRKEMFYLTTHATHFIYDYISSDIWYRTIQIAKEETRCLDIGYSLRLAARVILYPPAHRHMPRPLLHQSLNTG